MATTSYFEQTLSATDERANADSRKPGCQLEILVSSLSGEHQLYIRHVDATGTESVSVVPRRQARELLKALEAAVSYLRYL
jgi:hypothetical protein